MFDDSFDIVRSLEQQATALRRRQQFDGALAVLEQAAERLEAMTADAGPNDELLARIRAELADVHGMKGGVNRRRKAFAAALADYRAGVDAEGEESLDTHNLGNVVLMSILVEPKRLDDGSLAAELSELLGRLENRIKGSREADGWTWGDLAQFRLLSNDVEGARQAMQRGLRLGPTRAELHRTLEVMQEVAGRLESYRPERARQILDFVAEMKAID